jgi:hypothetical protein
MIEPTTRNPSQSNASKKAKKKRANPQQPLHSQDIDKVLAELAMDSNAPQPAAGGSLNPGALSRKDFASILSISSQHLDGELEMRKFFGSKVVSSKTASRTASKRANAANRSILTNHKPNWWPARLREGLSVRQLTSDELEDKLFRHGWPSRPEEAWWTVEYGKKYRAITMAFMQIVMSGGKQLHGPLTNST